MVYLINNGARDDRIRKSEEIIMINLPMLSLFIFMRNIFILTTFYHNNDVAGKVKLTKNFHPCFLGKNIRILLYFLHVSFKALEI